MSIIGTVHLSWDRESFHPVPLRRWAAGLPLAAAVLLHLPLWAAHFTRLWSSPHYQFFPFVLLGSLILGMLRLRDCGPLRPGSRRWSYAVTGVSCGLLALAALLWSPWLSVVGALATLAAVIFCWGGAELMRRLFPAWAFLWLVVPLPRGLDLALISALQTLTSRAGGAVLDELGVLHLVTGNVIEVPGRQFFVAEACSGIQSFYAILAGTWFVVLWTRRPLVPACALILSGIAWALLANVGRVVAVTVLSTRFGLDLTHGWRHEMFGILVFVVPLALLISTDRLLVFLMPIGALRRRTAGGADKAAEPSSDSSGRTRLPDFGKTPLAAWPMLLGYGVLECFQVWLLGPLFFAIHIPPNLAQRPETLQADAVPARWGPLEFQGFETKRRDEGNGFGQHSRQWRYSLGGKEAMLSVDYPFLEGWHELSICYQCIGWTLCERSILPIRHDGDGESGSIVSANLSKLDQHGYLLFALFDDRGRLVEPLDAAQTGNWPQRLRAFVRQSRADRGRVVGKVSTYQAQLFVTGDVPLTPAEREQARALFEQALGTFLMQKPR